MIDIPGPPGFDGLAFANGMLLIGHGGAGTVDVFDPQKRRVVAQINETGDVKGIAVDEIHGTIYIADAKGNNIRVVSAKDWKVTDTVPLQNEPRSLALSGDGSTLFIANWRAQSITAMDLAHGFRLKTIPVGGTPYELAFDPASQLLYATLQDSAEVVALDKSLNITRRIKLNASQPTGLVLDPSARRLYVAVRHAVSAVDLDKGTEVGRLPAPVGADSLWLDRNSGTLFVGAADGTVTLMRASASEFQPVADVRTDVRGSTLAYDSSRGLLLVPGGFEGKSKLVILKKAEANPVAQADAAISK